ncbi:MAG: hypothetical protein HY828_12725 [Actinobacteria bacterium]|nr:hypothetical protein [Actinomycetota bacterium]
MTSLPPPAGTPHVPMPPPPPAAAPVAALPPRAEDEAPPANSLFVPRPRSGAPVAPDRTLQSGIVVSRHVGPIRTTGAFGAAMVACYTATSAGAVLLMGNYSKGLDLWREVRARGEVVADDLTRATAIDDRTFLLTCVVGALLLLSAVATACWARRVAQNAVAIGRTDTDVRWATISWFIPVVWFFVGFVQIRKTPRSGRWVWWWQVTFVAPFAAVWFVSKISQANARFDVANYGGVKARTLFADYERFFQMSVVMAICLPISTLLAMRSVLLVRSIYATIAGETASA